MGADDPRNPDDADPKDSATDLAARIADGSLIDWPADGGDAEKHLDAARVEQLKAIAAIADLRRLTADNGLGPAAARTWGSLAIVGRIGAGQFGEVFRAWDTKLQREVALKILRAPDSRDPMAPSRAIDEARHLARVRHPNVLTVYGAEQIGDRTGIWTELIEGQTLELIVTKHGPLTEGEVVAIALDLSRALAAVHAAGIVHRHVKAQNVMREVGGRVVLMDFGTGISLSGGTTRPRDLSGTPLYLAPEIFTGAAPNMITDLYALAVLLFHLLTGDYPVQGATLDEVRANHESGNRRLLKDMAPTVSQPIAELIDRGLSAEPEQRYSSASGLEEALLTAAPPPRTQALLFHQPVRGGRRWFLAAGMAMVLALGLWFYRNSTRQSPSLEVLCEMCMGPNVEVSGATVSRDGRWLAVADAVSGDVLIRDLQSGKVRSLGLPAAMHFFPPSPEKPGYPTDPIFSADSKRLIFVWVPTSTIYPHDVWMVGILGDSPAQVSHWNTGSLKVKHIYDVAPDGKSILVALDRQERRIRAVPLPELAWVSLDGVPRSVRAPWGRVVSTGEYLWTTELPQSARVSPDGRYIAYEWEPTAGAVPERRVHHIYLLKSDGSEQREAVVSDADNSTPTWSPQGDRLFFTSDVSGSRGLWSVGVQEGVAVGAQTLAHADVGEVASLVIASDGRAHYLREMHVGDYIFITNTTRSATLADHIQVERTIAGIWPRWSEDGKVLHFGRRAQTPPNAQAFVTPMTFTVEDGREAVDKTEQGGRSRYPFVDGLSRERVRAFFEALRSASYSDVFAQGPPNSEERGLYWTDVALAHKLVGSSLYGLRIDVTLVGKVRAVAAIDVTSGKVTPVCALPKVSPDKSWPKAGSVGFALSPDSRSLALALTTTGRATLGVLEISTCEYRQIFGPYRTESTFDKVAWSPDGQAVLISEEFGDAYHVGSQILRVPAAGGEPQPVIRLRGTDRDASFAISAGGLLAFHPNPAFQQPFAAGGGLSLQLWRLDLNRTP